MSKVWVAGEVLVDLIPDSDGDALINGVRYRSVIGGGPANTARALGRLGVAVDFIGGISSDRYGHMAWMELERDGVGLDLVLESDRATAKALVSLDESGSASYRFEVEDSATFAFSRDWLPSGAPSVIHVGSLATVVGLGAEELLGWVRRLKESGSVVVFDPNVRPAFLADREKYRGPVEEWIKIADVVKASYEDIQWLYIEEDDEGDEVLSRWLHLGPSLVVVTKGEKGIVAFRSDESVGVPGVQVDVVDTVGAGDTVGAVIVESLVENGIEGLRGEVLSRVLRRAAVAAAITCSRQGANPPVFEELARVMGEK
jgi:fructokinase